MVQQLKIMVSVTLLLIAATASGGDTPLILPKKPDAKIEAIKSENLSQLDSSKSPASLNRDGADNADDRERIENKLVVRLIPDGSLKVESGSGPASWTYWVPVVSALISGLVGFGGALLGIRIGQRNTDKSISAAQLASNASIWQKSNETELKEIQAKLDSFYGPFIQMSKSNLLMAEDLRSRLKEGPGYRLLLKVFDADWMAELKTGDRTLVELICTRATELELFISSNSGMVESALLPYLARATAHFRILNLAYNKKLGTESQQFEKYVYPRHLDSVLDLEVKRLQARSAQLRAYPSACPGPLMPLSIPENLELSAWV